MNDVMQRDALQKDSNDVQLKDNRNKKTRTSVTEIVAYTSPILECSL